MIFLNGYTLGQWQRCKRPKLISETHSLSQWRPQSLLAACLRQAIFHLSEGQHKDDVTAYAVNTFLSSARQPGLDVRGVDTYSLSMDYCAMMRTIIEFLSRLLLLTLYDIPPLAISSNVSWQFLSHRDEAGTLHRWKFVDYLPKTDDGLLPELHSWEVFGDIAAFDSPMQLHLVAIGDRNGSHQDSPWCKIYKHPRVANIYRFQKRSGDGLEGDWKPVWFAGSSINKAEEWVDLMIRDNISPIKHINVTQVSDYHKAQFKKEVLEEAGQIQSYTGYEPREVPMSRYACDKPYTCPHQLFCYSELSLDDVGIYTKKTKEAKGGLTVASVTR